MFVAKVTVSFVGGGGAGVGMGKAEGCSLESKTENIEMKTKKTNMTCSYNNLSFPVLVCLRSSYTDYVNIYRADSH